SSKRDWSSDVCSSDLQGGLTVDLVGLLGAADDIVVGVTGQLQGASGLQLAGVAAFLITDLVVAEGHVHADVDGTAAVATGVVHGVAPRAVRAGFTVHRGRTLPTDLDPGVPRSTQFVLGDRGEIVVEFLDLRLVGLG